MYMLGEDASSRVPPHAIPADLVADAHRVNPVDGRSYGNFRAWQNGGTWHWGIDIPARPADDIVAPETMVIVEKWLTDSRDVKGTGNFAGYGPGGVVGRGLSGAFHLLGHLDPKRELPELGATLGVGGLVGHVFNFASGPHVHWEVRDVGVDEGPGKRKSHTQNPVLWLGDEVQTLTADPVSRSQVMRPGTTGLPWWAWALLVWAVSR